MAPYPPAPEASPKKRRVDIAVISDVHLGTYGCQAKELLHYLKSIRPRILVLNGDIIDIWQFNKRYFPDSHMKVIKEITKMLSKGVKVYYLTGNHDEMLRKFAGFKAGNFRLVNQLVLDLPAGGKAWFFHGDVFDVTMQHSRWIARLGAVGYDLLILLNSLVNWVSTRLLRQRRYSFSKKIKESVKGAVSFVNNFEQLAADIAISRGFSHVICGHIHQPAHRSITNAEGQVTYLNSGDWVENLTSLEYQSGQWTVYHHVEAVKRNLVEMSQEEESAENFNTQAIFQAMLKEMMPASSVI